MMTSGYYWINYQGNWQPAYFSQVNGYWQLIGYEGPVRPDELEEIGERLEK